MEARAEFAQEDQPLIRLEPTSTSLEEATEIAEEALASVVSFFGTDIPFKRQEALIQDAIIRVYLRHENGTSISASDLRTEFYKRMSTTILHELPVTKSRAKTRKGPSYEEQVIHHLEFQQSLAELRENEDMQSRVLEEAKNSLAEHTSPDDLLPDAPNMQDLVTNFIAWFMYQDERFDDGHKFIVLAMLYLDEDMDAIMGRLEEIQKKDKKVYAISKESLTSKYKQVQQVLDHEGDEKMEEFVANFVATKAPITPKPVVARSGMANFLNYWDIKALQHGNEAALERTVSNYTPLILSLIKRKLNLHIRDDIADRDSVRQHTILTLAEKFAMADPQKGRINTFIGYQARTIIDRALHSDEEVHKPEHFHRAAHLVNQNGQLPLKERMSDEEIAECGSCSVGFVAQVREKYNGSYLKLDKPAHTSDEPHGDTLGTLMLKEDPSKSPEEALIESDRVTLAHRICALLPENSQRIIQGYYLGGKTMQEIGDLSGFSRARAEQIINGDIRRIQGNANTVQTTNELTLENEDGFLSWLEGNGFTLEQQQWIMLYMGFQEGVNRRYNNETQIAKYLLAKNGETPDKEVIREVLTKFKQLQKADKTNGQHLKGYYTSETVTRSFKEAAMLCRKVREELEL